MRILPQIRGASSYPILLIEFVARNKNSREPCGWLERAKIESNSSAKMVRANL